MDIFPSRICVIPLFQSILLSSILWIITDKVSKDKNVRWRLHVFDENDDLNPTPLMKYEFHKEKFVIPFIWYWWDVDEIRKTTYDDKEEEDEHKIILFSKNEGFFFIELS